MHPKDLEKLLKLCRKQGIDEISFEGIHVKFGIMPAKVEQTADDVESDVADSLSPEQLMFYAVQDGL